MLIEILLVMKRYCQTLELVDDPELIRKYCEVHSHVWPEVIEGQRQVGILDMEIYLNGNRVFMICDTVDDFDWGKPLWPRPRGLTRKPLPPRNGILWTRSSTQTLNNILIFVS